MKKFFGYAIIASLFIGYFILHVIEFGFLVTLAAYALTALLLGIIALGVFLIFSDDKKLFKKAEEPHRLFDNPQ
jgi:hypothetical protein